MNLLSLSHSKYDDMTYDAALRARDRDPQTKHLRFLFYQYKPEAWYFELFGCARKVVLTGLMMFVMDGTATQIAVGLFVAFVSFGIYSYSAPFIDKGDTLVEIVSIFSMFMVLLVGLLFKVCLPKCLPMETARPGL